MSFHNIQFPPRIAYGASGGPGFNTSIATSISGFEQRNVNWRTSRCRWDISTGIKSARDMEEVLAFFRARFGKAYGFRFKDWTDYRATDQVLGIGNGKTTKFELTKTYKSGGHTYVRNISKPVENTLTIKIDGELTTAYSIDAKTGAVIFHAPPKKGAKITADFEFDVPARFDVDQIIVRSTGPGQFVADSVTIQELKSK